MTLKDFQEKVSLKYRLGEKLVTGHKKTYFDEAAIEYTKYCVTEALKAATDDAEIICGNSKDKSDSCGKWCGACNDPIINKDSILNAYSLDNIT